LGKLDSVTFGFVWDRLISITDESFSALIRSSFSPIVREALDATCQLFDSQCRSVAQAWAGPPSFTGTMPITLREILKSVPQAGLHEGDVLATNDPWIGTGQINDITVFSPVFSGKEIVAFAGAVSHLPDIGGQVWSATATDVFEEGFRIPPVKLMRRGVLDEQVRRFLRANVRLPDQTMADVMSDVSCVRTMGRLLVAAMREYELGTLDEISNRIIKTSAAAVRRGLQSLPSGSCSSTVDVEGFEADHKIKCRIDVSPRSMSIDYSGTSGKSDFGINSPYVYTNAYTTYAAKCVVAPSIPNNQGTTDIFQVSAPENSILNPKPPAACGARHITGWHTAISVWRALAEMVPERVVADPGLPSSCTIKGVDEKGRTFVAITVIGVGGTGARPDSDGLHSTGMPTVTSLISAEVIESTTPLMVEELKLLQDSGGGGKFRGGLGASYTIRNMSGSRAKVAFIGNKFRYPAGGLRGGNPGAPRRAFIDGKEVSPLGTYMMEKDSAIRVDNAGGGGFYNPSERSKSKIEEDVRNGFVSKSQATEVYGYH
jgi:N-methylhydantoinase B